MREIECRHLRAPARVIDIDIAIDYGGELVDVARFESMWCLVRNNGVAVAKRFLDVHAETTAALSELRTILAASNLPLAIQPKNLLEVTGTVSTLTVVICTRDRREGLTATLESLAKQSDRNFDVLVVDNSRDGGVARTPPDVNGLVIRCCHEPKPGLSRARNRALAEVSSDLVAWIDDDEIADTDWIAWIRRGFATPQSPDAVAGVMLPAELETAAQVNFERYGGFNKGRGMEPLLLVARTPSVPDPFYPLPNFGAGGNMAFRTEVLRRIGGFDNQLGAGTLTHGGEETRALSLLLESGSTILHWPPAVTWHYHRRTDDALEKQFFGYSAGLTAFYMSMILTSPKYTLRILGFVPMGVKGILANRNRGEPDGPPADFPEHLLRAGRKGLFKGAWLYLREVRRQRREDRLIPNAEIR
jgi:glycosyltransferase involved in cell wall biosynthesis